MTIDTNGLADRYRRERETRLRAEGAQQYHETTDAFLALTDDPYAGPDAPRAPIRESLDVLVVGGGFTGILVGARLREAGVCNLRIVEKGADFGGTWYWNRYPGLACDIESYIYMPRLEDVGYLPTEKYASGAEIHAYVRMFSEKFDLYRAGVFRTVVTGMRWDAEQANWIVSTNRDDVFRARFVVTAGGPLHKPKLPAIAGLERFGGRWFHTSRWDYAYTGGTAKGDLKGLRDKRVGIIGTGATAIQCVPHLGRDAKQLFVFQRTPSSVDIRGNRPTDPAWAATLEPGWQRRRMDNFNAIVGGAPQDVDLVDDGWTNIFRKLFIVAGADGGETDPAKQAEIRQLADFKKMEEIRARVDAIVRNPATAESLKPYYNQFCKRPCFHDAYLETFNRENVTLVDTIGRGVEAITENGLVALGRDYPLDCIIFATGFEFELSSDSDYTRRLGFEVTGRGGITLSQKWREGALTLHGMHSHGFPNYFICSILQAGLSPNLTHLLDEQARHVSYIVSRCGAEGIETVEATEAAVADWVEQVVAAGQFQRDFNKDCTPGYLNNEGKQNLVSMRNTNYGGGALAFFEKLRRWREAGNFPGLAVTQARSPTQQVAGR